MLAARFPYVTPSGHVGQCGRASGDVAPLDQLVDGGYLENTGLGTINDLSDIWLPHVRKWNTDELQKPQPKLIVPLVAYLDNATGTDKNAPKRNITNEFLLPPLAKLHAGSDAIADEASLQRASDLVAPDQVCPAGDTFCTSAISKIEGRIYAVYPASRPQSPHHSAGYCPASAGKPSRPRSISRRIRRVRQEKTQQCVHADTVHFTI
jgi:hypothetical protein